MAAVNTEEHKLTDERIGPKFEAEAGDFLSVVRTDANFAVTIVGERALAAHVDRRRQEVDNAVEQHLHTFVLKGGTRNHADEVHREGRLTDTGTDFFNADVLTLEVFTGEDVIKIS